MNLYEDCRRVNFGLLLGAQSFFKCPILPQVSHFNFFGQSSVEWSLSLQFEQSKTSSEDAILSSIVFGRRSVFLEIWTKNDQFEVFNEVAPAPIRAWRQDKDDLGGSLFGIFFLETVIWIWTEFSWSKIFSNSISDVSKSSFNLFSFFGKTHNHVKRLQRPGLFRSRQDSSKISYW